MKASKHVRSTNKIELNVKKFLATRIRIGKNYYIGLQLYMCWKYVKPETLSSIDAMKLSFMITRFIPQTVKKIITSSRYLNEYKS